MRSTSTNPAVMGSTPLCQKVLEWIKAAPEEFDEEVGAYFNKLAQEEFIARIGPDYDPDTHYDFMQKKKRE